MSFPAAAVSIGAQQTLQAMNPLDALMASINTNPYFIGLMMLSLNLGGRFLGLEITKEQEKFMSQPWVRRFFLIAVLFVATRNIIIAIGVGIIVILFLGYLFNENSQLCLWKVSCPKKEDIESEKKEGFTGKGLSPDEQVMLRRLLDKQSAAAEQEDSDESIPEKEMQQKKSSVFLTYMNTMSMLR